MLKNAKLSHDPFLTQIYAAIGQGGNIANPESGIYICPHHNFEPSIRNKKEEWADFTQDGEYLNAYGVCDTVEQVKEKFKTFFEMPERSFCVSFTPVRKDEQPSEYGWRWHKWGPYIGDKNPQQEYLYDEDDSIQEVLCYHVYELLE